MTMFGLRCHHVDSDAYEMDCVAMLVDEKKWMNYTLILDEEMGAPVEGTMN